MWSIVNYVIILRGVVEKRACSKAEGAGGGGVDLALGFKNFWDGVYNFFFCPPPSGMQAYCFLI